MGVDAFRATGILRRNTMIWCLGKPNSICLLKVWVGNADCDAVEMSNLRPS